MTELDQPIKIPPHLAKTIARMLSRDYPGTTADAVTIELGKPANERNIIGMFAAGSLEEALDKGVIQEQEIQS